MLRSSRHISRLALVTLLLFVPGCVSVNTSAVMAAGTGTGEADVPFEYDSHLLVVDVLVRATRDAAPVPARFIVDTGAGVCVLHERFATALSVSSDSGLRVGTSDGERIWSPVVSLAEITVSDVTVSDVGAVIMDLSGVESVLDEPLDGILGSNALRFFNLEIDYWSQTIRFSETPFEAREGHDILLEWVDGEKTPVVDCLLDDDLTALGELDTGAPAVFVPEAALKRYWSDHPSFQSSRGPWGLGLFGEADVRYRARVDSLDVGDIELENVRVYSTQSDRVLLGRSFLQNFLTRVNYARREVILAPLTSPGIVEQPSAAVALSRDDYGNIVVSGLWAGGPADRAGLRRLDRVLSINGREVASVSVETCRSLLDDPRVHELVFVVQRDTPVTITVVKGE